MGIRHLETFVRREVRGGVYKVNMEREIRSYAEAHNGMKPIIVFDLMALYRPFTFADLPGFLCGIRFNWSYRYMERFFQRLKEAGAELVFFYDGPVQEMKYDTWIQRQDEKYAKMIEIFDSIDQQISVKEILKRFGARLPSCTFLPLVKLAKKHGNVHVTFSQECDQALAIYASQVKALAIVSNDTDFLIFKGFWRYWSSDINFETLTTYEYNRPLVVRTLGLTFYQMRLLATLGGNDIVHYEEVLEFHQKIAPNYKKFHAIAQFVRDRNYQLNNYKDPSVFRTLLDDVFDRQQLNEDLIKRFRQSLDFYDTESPPPCINPSNDAIINLLLQEENTFAYQIMTNHPYNVTTFFTDMRDTNVGGRFVDLVIPIHARKAGIIIYHRQAERDNTIKLVAKLSHNASHSLQTVPIQFPDRITVPPLLDLYSKRDDIQKSLVNTKWQLFSWICSDRLDPSLLTPIPDVLRPTVVALFYLMEKNIIQLFEADLLLQISYDVTFKTYDIDEVQYPDVLEERPFRLTFLWCKIYSYFSKALRVVGLNNENPLTPFDGVLFHSLYGSWQKQTKLSEQVKPWRIYERLFLATSS
ncbi:uncharacterized protein LOC129755755 [Uranotaenia lowii]|uniref:uncharacterized protein LOC129755755 n=1 Tax=Uranotaenia lowii TaxID=190385 RepID=UPI00247A6A94|nr:uncharacterized protein LOC129755755 [Uranotaenia lowii]